MSLWVVVICELPDAARRRQVRSALRFAGTEIRPGVFELVARRSRLRRLLDELAPQLEPSDHLRVYRLCADCRASTFIFGEGELSAPPCAIIV